MTKPSNDKTKKNQICPECGVSFTCNIKNGEKHCWCMDYPPVNSIEKSQSCLCEDCLKMLLLNNSEKY